MKKAIDGYSMGTNTRMWLRRLVILGTPLSLAFIELWHPRLSPQMLSLSPQQVFHILSPTINTWLIVHLLQLPLFGLLALAVYLLVKDLQGVAASVSRVAMWFFIVFYTAFDSIVGIATGILIRNAQNLSPERQAIAVQTVEEFLYDPIVGDISVISVLGGLGWIVGVFAAAIAFSSAGAPRLASILLALSFIFASHPRPIGPLGMSFFFLAAMWLEFFWQSNTSEDLGNINSESIPEV